jgi:hypothetical protein
MAELGGLIQGADSVGLAKQSTFTTLNTCTAGFSSQAGISTAMMTKLLDSVVPEVLSTVCVILKSFSLT